MSDEFRFETFVDAHSNIFREYLSSLIAKLPESNEDYRAIQEQMEAIFQQYPKVLEAVDTETAAELSQQECAALDSLILMGVQYRVLQRCLLISRILSFDVCRRKHLKIWECQSKIQSDYAILCVH